MTKGKFAVFIAAMIICCAFSLCFAEGADYSALKKANGGKLAERIRFVTTIRPSVIFTFSGFSKRAPLEDILIRMEKQGLRGTFFVTRRELERNAANVELIASYWQELAIGLQLKPDDGFDEICGEISYVRETLARDYGVSTNYVRLALGPDSDALKEAVSAMGCVLFGQGANIVQSKHKDASDEKKVLGEIFGRGTISLARGELVHMRTDFYDDDTLAGRLMEEVKRRKIDNIAYRTYEDSPEINPANDSAYGVESIGDVMADKKSLWKYPVSPNDVPEYFKPENKPFELNEKNYDEEFFKRYIGAPTVNETNRMIGFNRSEMMKADKTGIIKGINDGTIFLTFDDWANDDSINHLLYVLRKHHVKGTFFIITWNMPNNPNLLRAIASEGHEIASHTNAHKAMAIDDGTGKYVPVMGEAEYDEDVNMAYAKLVDTVGDMWVNGRPALTRFLRPPTLAVSRSGTYSILNAGYTYIVSGYESTSDYAQISLQSLMTALQYGIWDKKGRVRDGAVIVMHMTHGAKHTAKALDLLLTANERRADGDPKKFKAGLLADYLADGYDQRIKAKKKS